VVTRSGVPTLSVVIDDFDMRGYGDTLLNPLLSEDPLEV